MLVWLLSPELDPGPPDPQLTQYRKANQITWVSVDNKIMWGKIMRFGIGQRRHCPGSCLRVGLKSTTLVSYPQLPVTGGWQNRGLGSPGSFSKPPRRKGRARVWKQVSVRPKLSYLSATIWQHQTVACIVRNGWAREETAILAGPEGPTACLPVQFGFLIASPYARDALEIGSEHEYKQQQ